VEQSTYLNTIHIALHYCDYTFQVQQQVQYKNGEPGEDNKMVMILSNITDVGEVCSSGM